MKEELLPQGSVVKIKSSLSKLMIIGYMKLDQNKKVRDYMAVKMPKGYESVKKLIVFDNEDIEKIYYKGYVDESINDYRDDMIWFKKRWNKNE